MAAGGRRRRLWESGAVACLLRTIHRSPALSLLFASTTTSNRTARDDVTASRAICSFPQTRWKVEKAAFNRERAYRDEHGSPSSAPPENYHLMPCIWRQALCRYVQTLTGPWGGQVLGALDITVGNSFPPHPLSKAAWHKALCQTVENHPVPGPLTLQCG